MTNEDLKRFYKDNPLNQPCDFVRLSKNGKIPADLLPANGNADLMDIFDLFEGSDSVIVDINEAGDKIRVDLDKEAQDKINALNGSLIPQEVIINNVPETATNGTLDSDDLLTLTSNDDARILFNNELYYLMDKGHTSGYITYSHVGIENQVFMIKAITVNLSNGTWVLNTGEVMVKE